MLEIIENLPRSRVKVKCHKCALDPELFGDAIFITYKNSINKGILPCGCKKTVKWTKDQYRILIQRRCDKLGFTLTEFTNDTENFSIRSTFKISCNLHGDFQTNTYNFLYNKNSCPACKKGVLSLLKTFPDSYFIKLFSTNGNHHRDTKFSRLSPDCWSVTCGLCGEQNLCGAPNLRRGTVPCSCRFANRRYFYIMKISDDSYPVALKFGITSDVKRRIYSLRAKSKLDISLISIYEFSSRKLCQKAETLCKSGLVCGVVDQQLMEDGSTETTYINNYDTIVDIVRKGGGVQIEN